MRKAITVIILFFLVYSCKQEKRNLSEIESKTNEVIYQPSILDKNDKDSINYGNWVEGKNFEYVLKETKDSIVIGDYMLNGTVISFISKDTLLFANNMDGWFFKINKIESQDDNGFKASVSPFNNQGKIKNFSMNLINRKDSIWEIDTFGNDFYAFDNTEKSHFILDRNLEFKNVLNVNKAEEPDINSEEPDSLKYFFRLKK